MSSGRLGSHRFRFDPPQRPGDKGPLHLLPFSAEPRDPRLAAAVDAARDHLLGLQHPDGYWVGELEGDTILESEYILLLAFLHRENDERAVLAAEYLRAKQMPEGGWTQYPGGSIDVSASVKAYFALKLTGHDPDAEYMVRARNAIRMAGGAEAVNSFTRYFLALLGVISYNQCPAVPPELMLIPKWMPFNIYEMSAWSRTILVPLSLLWAFRPSRQLAAELGIRELFLNSPELLPALMSVDAHKRESPIDWEAVFRRIDQFIKVCERLHLRPLRLWAIRRAADWMIKRFANSDGLGAIFPPIIWSVVALKCLGYAEDSPEVLGALGELDNLMIRENGTIRLQPCKSPIWDTAIGILALREAGASADHPAVAKGARWLVSKEVRTRGDWAVLGAAREPSGWFFEFRNEFYPDVDDTSMVLMALHSALPGADQGAWMSHFLLEGWSPHEDDADAAAVVAGRSDSPQAAVRQLLSATGQLASIRRGLDWLLAMQGRDGGWGAFDANNNRELFTKVPFADHNAMIDPSTVDLTARMLELMGRIGMSIDHPAVRRGLDFVWREQERDHSWYGRWGVNFIYGTWQSLVGLDRIGVPRDDPRMKRAADWLKSRQLGDGSWGESPRTYDEPPLRGFGPPTASQTAWAVMGLIAAGEIDSDAVIRGVNYLIDTQRSDGNWDEDAFTGTGFPRVFYLKYHLYRLYFPLMALARYERFRGTMPAAPGERGA